MQNLWQMPMDLLSCQRHKKRAGRSAQEGQEQRHTDGNMGVGAKCGNFGVTH